MNYRIGVEEDRRRIAKFNHEIFSEEIGQHQNQADGVLVDKFDYKNLYVIAERQGDICGLIAAHWAEPYSITEKFPLFFDEILPTDVVGEVRLFAVRSSLRGTPVAMRLIAFLVECLRVTPVTVIAISGIAEREGLYRRLGFRPIGGPVRCGAASFIPMLMRREDALKRLGGLNLRLRTCCQESRDVRV